MDVVPDELKYGKLDQRTCAQRTARHVAQRDVPCLRRDREVVPQSRAPRLS